MSNPAIGRSWEDARAELYTPEEIAERWRCSAVTVYRLLNAGKLEGFRVGRGWRIPEESLSAYENPHTTNIKEV